MMSDLDQYIKKRQQIDPKFADGFESGYTSFKIGVLLVQAIAFFLTNRRGTEVAESCFEPRRREGRE